MHKITWLQRPRSWLIISLLFCLYFAHHSKTKQPIPPPPPIMHNSFHFQQPKILLLSFLWEFLASAQWLPDKNVRLIAITVPEVNQGAKIEISSNLASISLAGPNV